MNGREAEDAAPVLEALPDIEQYIFCSSAGVYLKNDQMPHREEDPTDQKSRHKVKRLSNLHPSQLQRLIASSLSQQHAARCRTMLEPEPEHESWHGMG